MIKEAQKSLLADETVMSPHQVWGSSRSDVVLVEPECCPEDVVDWYLHGLDKEKSDQVGTSETLPKAKKLSITSCDLKRKVEESLVGSKAKRLFKESSDVLVQSREKRRMDKRSNLESFSPRIGVNRDGAETGLLDDKMVKHQDDIHINASLAKPRIGKLLATLSNLRKNGLMDDEMVKLQDDIRINARLAKPRIGKALANLMKLKGGQKTDNQSTPVKRSRKKAQREVLPSSSSGNHRRVVLSRLIQNKEVLSGSKVYYRGNNGGGALAEGWITGGIECNCCHMVCTLTEFEVHAGRKMHRPAANIILEDGRYLLDCRRQMVCNNKMRTARGKSLDLLKNNKHQVDSYDECCVCHSGGELIMCDLCGSAFHKSFLGLKDVPSGDWFCPSCCCGICGEEKLEQKTFHSVNDAIVRTCDQCEHKFHMGCARSKEEVKLKYCSQSKWFCSDRCEHMFNCLQELVGRPISLGLDKLTWRLLKPVQSDHQDPNREVLIENQKKLNFAVDAMHECFEPAKDPATGGDLVEDVIFNRRSEVKYKNFQGFYTAVLERKRKIVSVATVRVYGEIAEIPLVATRIKYRRRGMCSRLMGELEKQLVALGVERLILHAAPAVLNTWITKFGFSKMTDSERLKYLTYTFLDFQDTIMCQKLLTKSPSANLCSPGATTWSIIADADKKFDFCSPVSVLQGEKLGRQGF